MIPLWENLKNLNLHGFLILGRVHDPQNLLSLILDTPNSSKQYQQNPQSLSKHIISGNLRILELGIKKQETHGKYACRKIMKTRLTFLKIVNMGSRSIENMIF